MPNRGKTTWTNRVAPEPRPLVPKFRVPEYAVILRSVGNGLFRLLPGRPVPGVPLELHADAGRGLFLFIPEVRTRDGALFCFHGGGLIFGHPTTDDWFGAEIARNLGIVVASVRYHLAPAHPYPAAIDDGYDAWMWLLRNANTFDIDPARIAIGGQSAGGGLASALVQRACDGGAPYAVEKSLICPTLDKGTAARRDLDAEKHVV